MGHLEACTLDASSHHDPSVTAFYRLARHWLMFLKISGCNQWGKTGADSVNWGARKAVFSCFRILAAFKIMLATEGGKHFLQKISKLKNKRVYTAMKTNTTKIIDGIRKS